uniref:Uncharacterized protein n=1 Tax=Chelydra serpentina TaxID=8475 RepID=A0A8C3S6N8_CHESE
WGRLGCPASPSEIRRGKLLLGEGDKGKAREGGQRRGEGWDFRPVLPVSYVQSELAFEAEEECQLFLAALSLVYMGTDATKIDCRQSLAVLANF